MNTRQLRRVGDILFNETATFREINPQHPELIPIFLKGLALNLCQSVVQAEAGQSINYALSFPPELFLRLTTELIHDLSLTLTQLVETLQPEIRATQLYPERSPATEFGHAVFFYRLESERTKLYLGVGQKVVVANNW